MNTVSKQIENYVIENSGEVSNEKTTAEVLRQIFSNVEYPTEGQQRMSIENLDISALGENHYLVFVQWNSTSIKDNSSNTFPITYFLKKNEDGFEVISALTNNELLHLREKGYLD